MDETWQKTNEASDNRMDTVRACEVIDDLERRNTHLLADFNYASARRDYYPYTKTLDNGPESPNVNYEHEPGRGVVAIETESEFEAIDVLLEETERRLQKLEEERPEIKNISRHEAIFQGSQIVTNGSDNPRVTHINEAGLRYESTVAISNDNIHQEYISLRGAMQQSLNGFVVDSEIYKLTTPALLAVLYLRDNTLREYGDHTTGLYL